MGAREFLNEGELVRVDAATGTGIRVRMGDVWLTQNDGNDYYLKGGDAMVLDSGAPALVSAFEPSLLELYRADPTALRQRIERDAGRARTQAMGAFFARLFGRG